MIWREHNINAIKLHESTIILDKITELKGAFECEKDAELECNKDVY